MLSADDNMIQPYTPLNFEENRPVEDGGEKKELPTEEDIQTRIRSLEEDAYAKGLERGRAAGREEGVKEGQREIRDKLERLEGLISEIENFKQKKTFELLPSIVELSLEIAKKVVHKEIELDKNVIMGVAHDAMKRVGGGEEYVIIKVNPADYEIIGGSIDLLREQSGVKNITVETLATISPGGCSIETKTGEVDARIESQVKEIEDVIGTAVDS